MRLHPYDVETKLEAKLNSTVVNIDELFDCMMAVLDCVSQSPIPLPVSMVSKLPDVPQENKIYLFDDDTEPTAVVVCEPGNRLEVAVSESFVKECFEGEHGDRIKCIAILNDMLGKATGLIWEKIGIIQV